MMNGSVPDSAASAIAPGFGLALGATVAPKSGTSYPTHLPFVTAFPDASGALRTLGSHQIHFLRSLHGSPDGSAEARLYIRRRFAGHDQPHVRCAPRTPGASGSRRALR